MQFFEQIEHLRLCGHIQSGNSFITDNELRVECQGSGNADSLPLTARKFMGISVHILGIQTYIFHQACDRRPQFLSFHPIVSN